MPKAMRRRELQVTPEIPDATPGDAAEYISPHVPLDPDNHDKPSTINHKRAINYNHVIMATK
jgi:hypothetical protein